MSRTTSISVRFSDLDAYGHVNHSIYLTYFELGRAAWLEDSGVSLLSLADSGIRLVVAEVNVNYVAGLTSSSSLVVDSEISELAASYAMWKQVLRDDELIYATASVKVVAVNNSGRPTRFPKHLLA